MKRSFIADRLVFITYQNKRILLIDVSGCSAAEVEMIFRATPELVTTLPPASVLVLTDYTGSSFNQDTVRAIKETAVFNKAYVKKSAVVGASSLPPDFNKDVRNFSHRKFPAFETREEAMAWLVQD